MAMLGRLALLFVLVPILELVILIRLGQVVGFWPTLGLVLFTGLTGAILARLEGIRVLFQFRRELATGRLPGQALMDGISVLVGGALLLTPGILTDLAGFALLLPPTRRWIQRRVRKRLEKQVADGAVRFVTMGPGGFATWGAGGFTAGGADGGPPRHRPPEAAPVPGLDPTKGIVIEPDEP